MILVIDNFVSPEICNLLIKAHKEANTLYTHRDTVIHEFGNANTEQLSLAQYVNEKYENTVQMYYGKSIIVNYFQVVCWPVDSFQDKHIDFDFHTVTSVLYLNDNFTGGKTFFECGTVIGPKVGRIVFFEGNKIVHGVEKVTSGERWTSPAWYKEKL